MRIILKGVAVRAIVEHMWWARPKEQKNLKQIKREYVFWGTDKSFGKTIFLLVTPSLGIKKWNFSLRYYMSNECIAGLFDFHFTDTPITYVIIFWFPLTFLMMLTFLRSRAAVRRFVSVSDWLANRVTSLYFLFLICYNENGLCLDFVLNFEISSQIFS